MSRSAFGWDLPPGCSMRDIENQAGRDPTQLEEDVLEQLEKHNVPTAVCDSIMQILDSYQIEAARSPEHNQMLDEMEDMESSKRDFERSHYDRADRD